MPVGDYFQLTSACMSSGGCFFLLPLMPPALSDMVLPVPPLSALLHRMLDGAWCLSPEGPYRSLEVGRAALARCSAAAGLALPAESWRPASKVGAAPYSAPRLTQPG